MRYPLSLLMNAFFLLAIFGLTIGPEVADTLLQIRLKIGIVSLAVLLLTCTVALLAVLDVEF